MHIADAIFLASVAHQRTQIGNIQPGHLMDTDQKRTTNGHAAMTDLADNGRIDFQQPRQRRVVLQA